MLLPLGAGLFAVAKRAFGFRVLLKVEKSPTQVTKAVRLPFTPQNLAALEGIEPT